MYLSYSKMQIQIKIGDESNLICFTAICQTINKELADFVGKKYIFPRVASVHHEII
jgi:hypothetical protein